AIDTIAVLAAAGIPVRYFPTLTATPLVAFAALDLGASAAVVVTASHNPPEYNGYKVYSGNGAQIVPPEDERIAAAIAAVGPANEVPHAGDDLGGIDLAVPVDDEVFERYLAAVDAVRPAVDRDRSLRVVYTPLHGLGWGPVRAALAHAGYEDVTVVPEQAEPDGRFPTVRFPNPEEEAALDLVSALASERAADVLLANDPDVDRLAVGLPDAQGGYALLTGNQVGALLGDFVLANAGPGSRPLVVSSIVSSPMLAAIAAAYGARYETTLTGFKWICNAALDLERDEGLRFVFGYEEALGYTVGTTVRDKDGIGAAVLFADLAAHLEATGRTVGERLDDLYRRHGLWVSHQHGIVRPGLAGRDEIAHVMTRIGEARAPEELAGRTVTGVRDLRTGAAGRARWLPAADLVELALGGGSRALIRPSGTEPKLKIYVDLVREVDPARGPGEAAGVLMAEAADVARALAAFVGLV
ncbi:MAG TPA: phospho-sugar mutase, partial [Nitriliruptorales bacterium]